MKRFFALFFAIFFLLTPMALATAYASGETVYPLSDDDRDLIERVVMAESGSTAYEGMLGVAQVIRERVECWGGTPREVVTKPHHFAKPYYKGDVNENVREAVRAVFDRGERLYDGQTTYFHHIKILPYWTKSLIHRGTLGVQVFWGEDVELPAYANDAVPDNLPVTVPQPEWVVARTRPRAPSLFSPNVHRHYLS